MRGSVVIVGAGLVGLACGLALQREGRQVTVLDRGAPGEGASFGNAGHIAIASVIPQSTPGIWRQTLKMLRDPRGPLVARPGYVARHLPWFRRFLALGTPQAARAGTLAMGALMAQAWPSWLALLEDIGATGLVARSGALHVFSSAEAMRAARAAYELRREVGVESRELSVDEARQMEPALTGAIGGAVWVPGMGFVPDLPALARRMAEGIVQRDGRVLRAEVRELTSRGVVTTEGAIEADTVVLAAGAWSARLAARVGVKVPMVSERGYHVMLPRAASPLTRPLLLIDRKVAVTPMADGVRMASMAEFTAPDARADHARAEPVFTGLGKWVSGLDAEPVSRWVGPRPSVPDSRPVIGRAPGAPGVILAYGHGHLGLSLAALTGRVVADLAAGREPGIDMAAVSPLRFARGGKAGGEA